MWLRSSDVELERVLWSTGLAATVSNDADHCGSHREVAKLGKTTGGITDRVVRERER